MVPGVRNAGDGEEGIRDYESQSDDELIDQARIRCDRSIVPAYRLID